MIRFLADADLDEGIASRTFQNHAIPLRAVSAGERFQPWRVPGETACADRRVIEDLVLIWSATGSDEWMNPIVRIPRGGARR